MDNNIINILQENERRNKIIYAPFNPISGLGSVGERKEIKIKDFPIATQYLPVEMLDVPLVKKLIKLGSVDALVDDLRKKREKKYGQDDEDYDYEADRLKIIQQFVRIRCKHDFAFWAAVYVYIKRKGGGEDCLFRLTRPQRRFVARLERLRKAGKPIRIVLLKARQWGGSTTSQIYMAWLQLVHKKGLNSLIIAHQGSGSDEIKDMFDRMIREYPIHLLHEITETYAENEAKLVGVGKSGGIHRVPQRNCKIKVGTAERPDSCRGGDYNLVHLSEVGLWKVTDGKKPEDIVRSACSGILYQPYTMIVYESTANGTGNFFQREYDDAKDGKSQFEALFVSWFDIEQYSLPIDDIETFAYNLYANKDNDYAPSSREQSGRYLWWLWTIGASLEAINWYIEERKKYSEHAQMASEYPSDDIEAFVHSGFMVFDKYQVEAFRKSCRRPRYIGEVYGDAQKGKESLKNVRFKEDSQGRFEVWEMPEIDDTEKITNRYLVVVDIGGRRDKSDWSVIAVFDRLFLMDGGKPSVVAQWYGHCDMDILAWKAAQIAKFYDDALLVIEKNTLDTHKDQLQDADHSGFILNEIRDDYDNLYARRQTQDEIQQGLPRVYGFHTNKNTKPQIVDNLQIYIREGLYVERDVRCLDEYLCYEQKDGKWNAIIGKHDDILMTRGIGLLISSREMDIPRIVKREGRFSIKKKAAVSAATM